MVRVMAKTTTKPKLEVGQRVWLEELSWYRSKGDVRTVYEYEVVESNSSSAYVVDVDDLEKFKNRERVVKNRVNQRTHDARNSVSSFNVWLSKESFESNVKYREELKELRAKAIHLVKQMNVDELRKVLDI